MVGESSRGDYNHYPPSSITGPNLGCCLTISTPPSPKLNLQLLSWAMSLQPSRLLVLSLRDVRPASCFQATSLFHCSGNIQVEGEVIHVPQELQSVGLERPRGLRSDIMKLQSSLWSWVGCIPKPDFSPINWAKWRLL